MINYAALAKEAEITAPTAKQWLKVLAAAGMVYLLEPFMHPNLKYGVKAPKVYFTDTGLAAYLLRWSNAEILEADHWQNRSRRLHLISRPVLLLSLAAGYQTSSFLSPGWSFCGSPKDVCCHQHSAQALPPGC